MRRFAFVLLVVFLFPLCIVAQNKKTPVYLNSLSENWYIQAGLDMTLQVPYGYDFFRDVFPNGKAYGVNLGFGRWFTPELGLRFKTNWENGISLFENRYAEWLAPFHERGVNMDKGGYIGFLGDVQLNIHNLFWDYDEDRIWNFFVFPRGGLLYNFGAEKGSPLIGFGFGSTFLLNERFSVYVDVAYNGVSSGHTGVIKSTGVDNMNSNGYLDMNIGLQVNIGSHSFNKVVSSIYKREETIIYTSFWDNWFVQFGFDMTLFKPFNKPFSEVFIKGRTFGVDLAMGKWFSPEIGIRGRVNWENGIPLFENKRLEWVAPAGRNGINMDKGGCWAAYMDVPLSILNMITFYDADREWDFYIFPRVGLAGNIALGSCSPIVGGGMGCTYRIAERFSIYSDMAFQGITSDFFGDVASTGRHGGTKFNKIMDLNIGVQIDLGNRTGR